ncbi:MAG: STAS domain-containing protein [Gammaproteobacteria bacterium]|nr:STAS domain-containing protein [Gammaproteobacteria bacterium]
MTATAIAAVGGNRFLLSGSLRFDSVAVLWKTSLELIGGESPLVMDLGDVTFADSAALALLLAWTREARRRKLKIQFENAPEQMRAVAKASGLSQLIKVANG